MTGRLKSFLSIGFALGLLPIGVEGAGKAPKPPATCSACAIAYSLRYVQGRDDLMLMKEDGSQKTLLLAGAKSVSNTWPTWSPGGDWIAYSRYGGGGTGVWVIRWDGQYATRVADTCGKPGRVTWSPLADGSYFIAFAATPRGKDGSCVTVPGVQDLWAVEVGLGTPVLSGDPFCLTCALADHDRYWTDAAWSPSGTHFAATEFVDDGAVTRYRLYILEVAFDPLSGAPSLVEDASSPWLVPPPPGQDDAHMPDWAHVGSSLAVRATPGGDLWRLDLDLVATPPTVSYELLTAGSGLNLFGPRWSPDDQRFACYGGVPGTGTNEAWVVRFSPTTFTSLAREAQGVDWRSLVPSP